MHDNVLQEGPSKNGGIGEAGLGHPRAENASANGVNKARYVDVRLKDKTAFKSMHAGNGDLTKLGQRKDPREIGVDEVLVRPRVDQRKEGLLGKCRGQW